MVVAPDGTLHRHHRRWCAGMGALAEAQALLARRDGQMVSRLDEALGPDLGQCCGGHVLLTIERIGAADRADVETFAQA